VILRWCSVADKQTVYSLIIAQLSAAVSALSDEYQVNREKMVDVVLF